MLGRSQYIQSQQEAVKDFTNPIHNVKYGVYAGFLTICIVGFFSVKHMSLLAFFFLSVNTIIFHCLPFYSCS